MATLSSTSGIIVTRKKNASPAATKNPSAAKKRAYAPRTPANMRGRLHVASDQAAVHLQRHAGHVRRALGREEDHDVRELLRRADAAERHVDPGLLDELVLRDPRLLGPAEQPVGENLARTHDVDRDVVLAEL